MNYNEAINFLETSFKSFQTEGKSAYNGGVEVIGDFCRKLDNPQRDYYTIHVAGTNGKGSTAHILASILQAAGYRTGLYTSPHLYSFRERIRVDGEPITERAVTDFVNNWGAEMISDGLSFFEMTTAMAFEYFTEIYVEVAIIETGLGGRLDATNIIVPLVSVITNVGFDHTDILGDTLERIAIEKAGIIKRGIPVIVGESSVETSPVFERIAAERGSLLIFADRVYECLEREATSNGQRLFMQNVASSRSQFIDLDLTGEYQAQNMTTVMAVLDILKHATPLNISTRALNEGTRTVSSSTGLNYRWQIVEREPLTIFDCGHNIHSFERIVRQIENTDYDKLYMVLGFSADKNAREIVSMLPKEGNYVFTRASSHRAMSTDALSDLACEYGLKYRIADTPQTAYDLVRSQARERDMIFVGGSFYILGEIDRT